MQERSWDKNQSPVQRVCESLCDVSLCDLKMAVFFLKFYILLFFTPILEALNKKMCESNDT